MTSKSARLDRFISAHTGINRRAVRGVLASGRITVDGSTARDINLVVGQFSHITLDGEPLQQQTPRYYMMHKPFGILSATRDHQHPTALALLPEELRSGLHIAGRLDINSSGLLLLSNDGRWTSALSQPEMQVAKQYHVELENTLSEDDIHAFAEGMYFAYENITTRPATLRILGDREAEVTLCEGRYRQIRRMFGQRGNRVTALHRFAIGGIQLDNTLAAGQFRPLTTHELSITG